MTGVGELDAMDVRFTSYYSNCVAKFHSVKVLQVPLTQPLTLLARW